MVVFYNIQGRWVGVVLKIIDDEGVYIGDRIEGYYFSLYVICNTTNSRSAASNPFFDVQNLSQRFKPSI